MPQSSRSGIRIQPLTASVLLVIGFYQRWVSPHKGFVCAYRVHTGCASCSALGYRAVRRYGVWRGIQVLRKRTYLCGVAHRRFSPSPPHYPVRQRGECDLGCDSPFDGDCDLRGSRVGRGLVEGISCCDVGGCDTGRRDRRNRKDNDLNVYLPRPHGVRRWAVGSRSWG